MSESEHVTRHEFGQFVQVVIQEQERAARRHDQVLVEMARMIDASEQRLRVELRVELAQVIDASEERLRVDIGRAARAATEEHRREIGVLDDRYRDLPGRVAALERGLREHIEDAAAHGRPRRPTRKR